MFFISWDCQVVCSIFLVCWGTVFLLLSSAIFLWFFRISFQKSWKKVCVILVSELGETVNVNIGSSKFILFWNIFFLFEREVHIECLIILKTEFCKYWIHMMIIWLFCSVWGSTSLFFFFKCSREHWLFEMLHCENMLILMFLSPCHFY